MISWRHVTKWTRYVPHARAEDYCRLGWCIATIAREDRRPPLNAFDGTPHAAYSVLCVWLCQCSPIEPREPVSPAVERVMKQFESGLARRRAYGKPPTH